MRMVLSRHKLKAKRGCLKLVDDTGYKGNWTKPEIAVMVWQDQFNPPGLFKIFLLALTSIANDKNAEKLFSVRLHKEYNIKLQVKD